MVIKVYISGISGNKEVKKRQQRVLLILDSKNIKYDVVDIAEPGSEDDKDFMQNNSTSNGATISDPKPRHPLPPQIFNDDAYCGDYDLFDMANEVDEMEKFLKLASGDTTVTSTAELKLENGNATAGDAKDTEPVTKDNEEDTNIEETNPEVPANDDDVVKSKESSPVKEPEEVENSEENQTDEQKLENGSHEKPPESVEDKPDEEDTEKAEDDS